QKGNEKARASGASRVPGEMVVTKASYPGGPTTACGGDRREWARSRQRCLQGRAASGQGAGKPHRSSDYNGTGRVPRPPAGRPAGQAEGPSQRRSMKIGLISLVVLLVICRIAVGDDGDAPKDQPAKFKITTKRKDDSVEVRADKDKTVFAVKSPFGISQA